MNQPGKLDILVVDDDQPLASALVDLLSAAGYAAVAGFSAAEALSLQQQHPEMALALVDLMMPDCDGLTLMEKLRASHPELPVVIMTGFATIETAVEAIKRGAEDYLTKPCDQQAVLKKVGRLMEIHQLRRKVAQLEENLQKVSDPFGSLVFVSPAMQKVVERAHAVAGGDATVLIIGETGTGKELLARAIHRASRRVTAPFIPVNCGALPRELVETELFGVRRGAYTGAFADAPGLFLAAGKGTMFLDEIGEMPRETQVKLLRILQEHELRAVGSTKSVKVDVRVIAATNRPLVELRRELLREDLYFRLCTVVLEIPPLRTRREDILVLSQYFTAGLAERYGRHITLGRAGAELLLNHPFPGNVRELENLLESVAAVSLEDPQVITDKDLKPLLLQSSGAAPISSAEQPLALDEMERIAVERAIRLCNGNRTRAAALLGISRDTLYRKIRDLKTRAETYP